MKAIIVNRISDTFLFLGILLIYFYFYSLEFYSVFPLIPFLKNFMFFNNISIIDIISLCLMIGAFGKSAQLGFHI